MMITPFFVFSFIFLIFFEFSLFLSALLPAFQTLFHPRTLDFLPQNASPATTHILGARSVSFEVG